MWQRIFIILAGVILLFTIFILWSIENFLMSLPVRSEYFSASNKALATLLKLPPESVNFVWLSEPNSPGGITIRDSQEPTKVILHGFTHQISEKYFVHLYLDPTYRSRIDQDRAQANSFINTNLLYSYLLTKAYSENLNTALESFCTTDCNLENISVVR